MNVNLANLFDSLFFMPALREKGIYGYPSTRFLPKFFFDIYFHEENNRHGWSVSYICEIAEALEDNGFVAGDFDDIVFHASMFGTDLIDAIENYKEYESEWDAIVMDGMGAKIPEDDTDGFGHRSIWELDEP